MRTREEIFDVWAVENGTWSPWVKPAIFTQLTSDQLSRPDTEKPREWTHANLPDAGSGTALVLELPGATAIRLGAALTARGYRPVPLFNGVPHGSGGFVPTDAIARLLVALADDVRRAGLSLDAPPAFLLDSDRMAGSKVPTPGEFDNRWMVFPQDFPSASFLQSRGLRRVLVVQRGAVADDLARILIGFRERALEVLVMSPDAEARPEPAILRKTPWLRTVLFRAMVLLSLRRNSAGGFGASVPEPSQTGFFT